MKDIEKQIYEYLKKTQYYKTKKRIKIKKRGPVVMAEPFSFTV